MNSLLFGTSLIDTVDIEASPKANDFFIIFLFCFFLFPWCSLIYVQLHRKMNLVLTEVYKRINLIQQKGML